jgi:cbb3-type cytochrome oxidase maturation protein
LGAGLRESPYVQYLNFRRKVLVIKRSALLARAERALCRWRCSLTSPAAFLWSLLSGQYDDVEGAALRILDNDDIEAPRS